MEICEILANMRKKITLPVDSPDHSVGECHFRLLSIPDIDEGNRASSLGGGGSACHVHIATSSFCLLCAWMVYHFSY